MYLSDSEINRRLDEMGFESDDPSSPFSPQEQIQPCSIDLRLSNVFWQPQSHKKVDLRKSALLELKPRRYWKKVVLRSGECITLKPGRLLLGRVSEKFTIPADCAGKIEGRSSFARLGLSIHCTGDFINPGYRGHMPLELVNNGPNPIKIFPHIPICQLALVKLLGTPQRRYGDRELYSKYMDDDGGPSYWWRDKRIRALQVKFAAANVELRVQEEILATVGVQEPEVIERFEKHVEKLKDAQRENAEFLIASFAKSEDRLRTRHSINRGMGRLLLPAFVGAAIAQRLLFPVGYSHYIIWGSTLVSICPFLWSWFDNPQQYLGTREVENANAAPQPVAAAVDRR
jgi:deoxycytidine triphosphate deaminase